jgi:hypothetical protein
VDNLEFEVLSVDEAASLEDPFEEREVREVIKGMDRDKALGSDGFSSAFFSGLLGGGEGGTSWRSLRISILMVSL